MAENAISIKIDPRIERLAKQLKAFPFFAVARAIDRQNQFTIAAITEKKLSFPSTTSSATTLAAGGLRNITARLKRSIRATKAQVLGDQIESAIGSNVEYAAIHEFGGQTKPHIIRAKNAKALVFSRGSGGGLTFYNRKSIRAGVKAAKAAGGTRAGFMGDLIFRKEVHHPGSKMPARFYIRNTLRDRLPEYASAIGKEIDRQFNLEHSTDG